MLAFNLPLRDVCVCFGKKHHSQCHRDSVCCFSFVLKASSFESQPIKSVALTQCFGFAFSQMGVPFNQAEKTIYFFFLRSSIPWSSWTFKGRPQKCNCDQSWITACCLPLLSYCFLKTYKVRAQFCLREDFPN